MVRRDRGSAWFVGAVVAAGALLRSGDAHAGDYHSYQVYAPVGATLGAAFNPKNLDNGFILGGEASVVAIGIKNYLWGGGYVDAVHDFGAKATRISIGPEFGLLILGFDGGLVLSTLDGLHPGIVARVLITLPIVSGYARIGSIFNSPQEGVYGEIGALVKIPIPLLTDGAGPEQVRVGPPPEPPPPPPEPETESPSMPIAK